MGVREKLRAIFHTKDGEIQRAYSSYDKAVDLLDARDKNPNFDRQKELEEQLKECETLTLELLKNYEGVKSWKGVFREMHINLARIYLRTGRFDDAMKECDKVAEYDPLDADELRNAIQEAKAGKKLESSQLDEVGVS
ncbi:TPA: tetratricopeptide repeat protein [Candidatus Poribacteria bacterium]|nr:tetratricopeptide repeat protein [Candidatus Poribacteria bacterium]